MKAKYYPTTQQNEPTQSRAYHGGRGAGVAEDEIRGALSLVDPVRGVSGLHHRLHLRPESAASTGSDEWIREREKAIRKENKIKSAEEDR